MDHIPEILLPSPQLYIWVKVGSVRDRIVKWWTIVPNNRKTELMNKWPKMYDKTARLFDDHTKLTQHRGVMFLS